MLYSWIHCPVDCYCCRYLMPFVDQDTRVGLEQLLSGQGKVNVTFTEYNWQLNKL